MFVFREVAVNAIVVIYNVLYSGQIVDSNCSVTRWADYLFNIWQFYTENLPISVKIAKIGSKFCQTLNKSSKKSKAFNILLKGEISPNLVTLILREERNSKMSSVGSRDAIVEIFIYFMY